MRLFECYNIKPEFTTIPIISLKDIYIPNLITVELEEVDKASLAVTEDALEKAICQMLKVTMSCYSDEEVDFYVTSAKFDYVEVHLHQCGEGCNHG